MSGQNVTNWELMNQTASWQWFNETAIESQIMNETTIWDNFTTSGSVHKDAWDYLSLAFSFIVIIVGVPGNILVMSCFLLSSKKIKGSEIFVISLAFADLMGTLSIPVAKIVTILRINIAQLGEAGCGSITWLSLTSVTVSAFLLVAISFDRYIRITRPFQPKLGKQKAIVITAVLWIMASSLGVVYFIDERSEVYEISPGHWVCATYWFSREEEMIHTVATFLTQMLFPFFACLTIYTLTIKELAKKPIAAMDHNGQASEIIMARNKRAIKWIITAVVTFHVLVLPYNIFILYLNISHVTFTTTILHWFNFLSLVLMLNSCANPIIYARLYDRYRRTLLSAYHLLCQKLVKERSKTLYVVARKNVAQVQPPVEGKCTT